MTYVTRRTAPADTTLTARGCSDDTFDVHLATGPGLDNDDSPTPPMTLQQDGYSMALTLQIPAGTRLSLWRGADDDVVA